MAKLTIDSCRNKVSLEDDKGELYDCCFLDSEQEDPIISLIRRIPLSSVNDPDRGIEDLLNYLGYELLIRRK